jgi:DNA-directed RNA polymerase subunit A'
VSKNYTQINNHDIFLSCPMASTTVLSSAAEKEVQSVAFGLLSASEIEAISCAHIVNPSTDANEYMKAGSLGDPRMGIISPVGRYRNCETCGLVGCAGHFGHIVLAEPIPHPLFLKHIRRVLAVVCIKCGRYIPRKETCSNCGTGRCQVSMPRTDGIPRVFVDDEELSASQIYRLFVKVDSVDGGAECGVMHPQNMIMTHLLVPPPCVRVPASAADGGHLRSSHLTQSLSQLIVCNNELAQWRATASVLLNSEAIKSALDRVWNHVSVYIGTVKSVHPSGKLLESLYTRLTGKDGRLRKFMYGKRVEFSARTVIVPDPNLAPDQLLIPRYIADVLTIPIRVTNANVAFLTRLLQTYGSTYIHSIVQPNGSVHKLYKRMTLEASTKMQLYVSQTVECPMSFVAKMMPVYVGFNRQPTLHMGSFMGFKAVIAPEGCGTNAVGVPPLIVTPFNADFDGDEMNIHMPQSDGSRADMETILSVEHHMRSGAHVTAQVALLQDSLTTIFMATSPDIVTWTRQEAGMIIARSGRSCKLPVPAIIKPVCRWTTHQLLSTIFPDDFNYGWPTQVAVDETLPPTAPRPCVKNGRLLFGRIAKVDAGPNNHGMLDSLFLHVGKGAVQIMADLQRMLLQISDYIGFSVGLDDMVVRDACLQGAIDDAIGSAIGRVYSVYSRHTESDLIPGMTVQQTLETRVIQAVSDARQAAEQLIVSSLTPRNALNTMASAGSKGSKINIVQIMCLLGQQHRSGNGRIIASNRQFQQMYRRDRLALDGKAAPDKYFRRWLPHFQPGDWKPDANGFVANSLFNGLSPNEFWAHAQCGREGMIDTPLATPVAGTMYRNMCKFLADYTVSYTGAVFDGDHSIVQFAVNNGDGDPVKLKQYTLRMPEWSDRGMLLDDTRAILRLSQQSAAETTIQTISRLVRTAVEAGDTSTATSPPTSDLLCMHARSIIAAIARLISSAVVGLSIELVMSNDPNLVSKLSSAELDASADIFNAWYTVTLSHEMQQKQAAQEAFGWHSCMRAVHLQTVQPIDVSKCGAIMGQNTRTCTASRYQTVLAVMELSSELIVDANRCTQRELRDHVCTGACLGPSMWNTSIDVPLTVLRSMLAVELLALEHPEKLTLYRTTRVRTVPESLLAYVREAASRSATEAGQAIGICSAMSICEPSTQLTLNTFSVAGQKSVGVGGLPRLIELFNTGNSKEPTMSVRMNPPMPPMKYATAQQKATLKEIMDCLLAVYVRDVVASYSVYYLPGAWSAAEPCDAESMSVAEALSIGTETVLASDADPSDMDLIMSDWMMRIELSSKRMLRYSVSVEALRSKIADMFSGMHVVSSADNIDDPHPFIYMRAVRGYKTDETEHGEANCLIMTRHYRTILRKILLDTCIGGISGITSVHTCEQPVFGVVTEHRDETVLLLGGVSAGVLTAHASIDPLRTTTSSISATYELFGVEAARRMFEIESASVFQMAGAKSNPVHLSLLADIFTKSGHFTCATQTAIVSPSNVFSNMSFRQPVKMAINAAVNSTTDHITSSAASTALGKHHVIPTASFDLLLDYAALETAPEQAVPAAQMGGFFEDASSPPILSDQEQLQQIVHNLSSPAYGVSPSGAFSPTVHVSPGASPSYMSAMQTGYSPTISAYLPWTGSMSPARGGDYRYGPLSPNSYSSMLPTYVPAVDEYSPTSPGYYASVRHSANASTMYSPTLPGYHSSAPATHNEDDRYSPVCDPQDSDTSLPHENILAFS